MSTSSNSQQTPSASQVVVIGHRNIANVSNKGKEPEMQPASRAVDSDVQMAEIIGKEHPIMSTFSNSQQTQSASQVAIICHRNITNISNKGKEREMQPVSRAVESDVQMAETITEALPASQVAHPLFKNDVEMIDVEQNAIPKPQNLMENIIFREVSTEEVYAIFCFDGFDHSRPFRFPEIKTKTGRPEFISMRESRETQWYYRFQPYLGFVPSEDVFEGPIFGRFKGNRTFFESKVVPHCPVPYRNKFIFDPHLSESWLTIEAALSCVIDDLFPIYIPITAPRDEYPSDTKFFEPKDSVKRVVDSVLFAQKLFLHHIARVRYSICHSSLAQNGDWVATSGTLPNCRKFDQIWLRQLCESKALTTKSLAGIVVGPKSMELGYKARGFAKHGVPVYVPIAIIHRTVQSSDPFSHGPDVTFEAFVTNQGLEHLYVNFRIEDAMKHIESIWENELKWELLQIAYIPAPYAESQESAPLVSPLLTEFSPTSTRVDLVETCAEPTVEILPTPHSDSQQQPGQWWFQFYKMRVGLGDDFGAGDDETVQQEQQRLKFEKLANLSNTTDQPPNFPTSYYVWEVTPDHPTFLLRRFVRDQEILISWRKTPVTHRIYDAYENEWDLYHPACNFQTFTLGAIEEDDPSLNEVELTPSGSKETIAPDIALDDKRIRMGVLKAVHQQRLRLLFETEPLLAATRRFGLMLSVAPLHTPSAKDKVKWFYHLGYKDVHISSEEVARLESALYCLKNNHLSHLKILLDIYANPTDIINKNNVLIRHIPNALFSFSRLGERNLYLISFPGDHRQDWFIGITQATDLVFAMREGQTASREMLVEFFLLNGAQFYTLAPVPQRKFFPNAPDIPSRGGAASKLSTVGFGLPLEPESKRYTMKEFFEYESNRERFLDSPFGRIAGRSGGIVARMWRRDASKLQARIKQVNKGPTELAIWEGIRVQVGPGEEFYDDELKETTDGFVCGQYRARKDPTPGVDDWHKISWYMTNAAFNSRNDSFVCRWNHVDEMKFLKMELDIYEDFTPLSASKWKKQARAKQGEMETWLETHCQEFIKLYLSHRKQRHRVL